MRSLQFLVVFGFAAVITESVMVAPINGTIKLGGLCDYRNPMCLDNAVCTNRSSPTREYVCMCAFSYRQNAEQNCVHSYKEKCLVHRDCDKGLKCDLSGAPQKTGRCKCTFKEQRYNHETKMCESLFDQNCQDDVWNACKGNMICETKCVCPKDLNPTLASNDCKLGFNQECNLNLPHNNGSFTNCDSSRGLACLDVENRCKCDFLYLYDKEEGRCLGIEDAHCDPFEESHSCSSGFQCQQVGALSLGYCKEIRGWTTLPVWLIILVTVGVILAIIYCVLCACAYRRAKNQGSRVHVCQCLNCCVANTVWLKF